MNGISSVAEMRDRLPAGTEGGGQVWAGGTRALGDSPDTPEHMGQEPFLHHSLPRQPRVFFIFQEVAITDQCFRKISQANSINPFPSAPCN